MNCLDINDSVFCVHRACLIDLECREHEIQVYSFPQTWSNTSLGFGGIAGQAFTSAQTTVVLTDTLKAAVYFSRRLAYIVKDPSDVFFEHLRQHEMTSVRNAHIYRKKND